MDRIWRPWNRNASVETPTDDELGEQSRQIAVAKEQTDLEKRIEELEADRDNRKLRRGWALGAVTVMLIQIAAANAIFVWYGDTNGWEIPTAAISVWLTSTVIQIVSVVLVITHYLFPSQQPKQKTQ